MSTNLQPLIAASTLTNADVTYFTATVPTQVYKLTACNPAGNSPTWMSVNWIPSGGSVGAGNLIVSQRYIQPGETWDVLPMIGQILGIGDKISMKASAGSIINVFASGITVSG